jgi:hypothetical protein
MQNPVEGMQCIIQPLAGCGSPSFVTVKIQEKCGIDTDGTTCSS